MSLPTLCCFVFERSAPSLSCYLHTTLTSNDKNGFEIKQNIVVLQPLASQLKNFESESLENLLDCAPDRKTGRVERYRIPEVFMF